MEYSLSFALRKIHLRQCMSKPQLPGKIGLLFWTQMHEPKSYYCCLSRIGNLRENLKLSYYVFEGQSDLISLHLYVFTVVGLQMLEFDGAIQCLRCFFNIIGANKWRLLHLFLYICNWYAYTNL